MKNNLPFFSHDSDAGEHVKHEALISRYGYEGYGRFWRLNELVASAEECKLDISRKVYFNQVANKLHMKPEDLQEFIDFLSDPDECGLIKVVDNLLITDRTQEDFNKVNRHRERSKNIAERQVRRANGQFSRANGENTRSNGKVASNFTVEQSRAEQKQDILISNSNANISRYMPGPAAASSPCLAEDPGFIAFAEQKIRGRPDIKHPRRFLEKILANLDQYDDWIKEFEESKPSQPQPPPPATCPDCGAKTKAAHNLAQCTKCSAYWEYDSAKHDWIRTDKDDPFADDPLAAEPQYLDSS